MADIIQVRRDTAANWTSANPTLANGEQGYETDTSKFKFGDGATVWTSLSYFTATATTPLTTKGDLYGYSTTDARIPVGTTGQVLEADSAEATGMKWATPVTGVTDHTLLSNIGTNTHTVIDTHLSNTSNPHTVTKAQVLSGDLIVDADVDASAAIQASKLKAQTLGTPTFSTVQHMQDIFHSAGHVDGHEVTDDGDGSITISAGNGLLRAVDDETATLYMMDCATSTPANVVLVDNALNYLYVEYNAGNPRMIATTTKRSDHQSNIAIGTVYRDGIELDITKVSTYGVADHAAHMIQRTQEVSPFAHVSGAIISETGTRNIGLTAGVFWHGLERYTTAALDTSVSGSYKGYYQDGIGGWTKTTSTQVSNLNYDDGSGTLAELGQSKYGVHWLFIGADGGVNMVMGRDSYSLVDAEAAQIPSNLPPHFELHARVLAKITVQKSATTFTSVESAFANVFATGLATDHADLLNIGTNSHTDIDTHIADVSIHKEHPATTVDNTVARYNGTDGTLQSSGVVVNDTNDVSGVGDLSASGVATFGTGLSATNGKLILNGSSDIWYGPWMEFERAGVNIGYIGAHSGIVGSDTDDLVIQSLSPLHLYSNSALAATFDSSQNLLLTNDLAISEGGTGASTASAARIALGLDQFDIQFQISTGENSTFNIHQYAQFGYTINHAYYKTDSGTITVAIKIDGTDVTGLSALSLSSTEGNSAATAAKTVTVGNTVTVVTSSNSTAVNTSITLHCTRS